MISRSYFDVDSCEVGAATDHVGMDAKGAVDLEAAEHVVHREPAERALVRAADHTALFDLIWVAERRNSTLDIVVHLVLLLGAQEPHARLFAFGTVQCFTSIGDLVL